MLQNKSRFLGCIVLVFLLALVRFFENQLFYDPFLDYFKGDYLEKPLPDFNVGLLFLGLVFRFALNALISLGILYFLFKDKDMILFAGVLYLFLFFILILAYFGILYFYDNSENLLFFYVRRFLIQPLFVIVFIPAFYFQKLTK